MCTEFSNLCLQWLSLHVTLNWSVLVFYGYKYIQASTIRLTEGLQANVALSFVCICKDTFKASFKKMHLFHVFRFVEKIYYHNKLKDICCSEIFNVKDTISRSIENL